MKLLKTITHPDFPTPGIETVTREAARIVLVDEDGLCPILYVGKFDACLIPGWGIDEWEDIRVAVVREAREETGCEIEILWEVGKTVEYRDAKWYTKWVNLKQTSYCFYGKIISKWTPAFTQNEIEKWFELRWIPIGEVLGAMSACKPIALKAQLVKERDSFLFEEGCKLLKAYL